MLCFAMFLCFVFYRSSVSATHIQTHLQYIHIGTYKCKHMPGLQAYRGNLHTQKIVSTHSYASGGSVLVKEDSDDFAKGSEDSRAEVGG